MRTDHRGGLSALHTALALTALVVALEAAWASTPAVAQSLLDEARGVTLTGIGTINDVSANDAAAVAAAQPKAREAATNDALRQVHAIFEYALARAATRLKATDRAEISDWVAKAKAAATAQLRDSRLPLAGYGPTTVVVAVEVSLAAPIDAVLATARTGLGPLFNDAVFGEEINIAARLVQAQQTRRGADGGGNATGPIPDTAPDYFSESIDSQVTRKLNFGPHYEFTGRDLSGFVRFEFSTVNYWWENAVAPRLQAYIGLQIPIIPREWAIFGSVGATIFANHSRPTFDWAEAGMKFTPFSSIATTSLTSSYRDLAIIFSAGMPFSAERNLPFNRVRAIIDARVSFSLFAHLRVSTNLGIGVGDQPFWRLGTRFDVFAIREQTDTVFGVFALVAGFEFEYRRPFDRALAMVDQNLLGLVGGLETSTLSLLLRYRLSGELGRAITVTLGWNFN